jgi:hypothetical protein
MSERRNIMSRALTLNIPDDLFRSLSRIAEESGQSPEELAAVWFAEAIRSFDEDPLLKLAGCIELPPGSPPLINEAGEVLFDPFPEPTGGNGVDHGG